MRFVRGVVLAFAAASCTGCTLTDGEAAMDAAARFVADFLRQVVAAMVT